MSSVINISYWLNGYALFTLFSSSLHCWTIVEGHRFPCHHSLRLHRVGCEVIKSLVQCRLALPLAPRQPTNNVQLLPCKASLLSTPPLPPPAHLSVTLDILTRAILFVLDKLHASRQIVVTRDVDAFLKLCNHGDLMQAFSFLCR